MLDNVSIYTENLVTGYTVKNGSVSVTDGINASLRAGELTCLLGPNGAGKSTLLKTLSAFIAPLRGSVYVEGRKITDYSSEELAKILGVVLTERVNSDNMTVCELVGLGRSPYTGFWGRLTANDKKIVDEAIALVGIEYLRNRTVGTLSDGERQKAMIAKVLAQETTVVFLDEPTAFLDYPSKVEIMQLLRRLSRIGNKTILMSTHDLELALQIADKVWLIDKAHGVTVGTPEDLAINGMLSLYFERDDVKFDVESGHFRIIGHFDRKIRLSGFTHRDNLVKKALMRCGFEASRDADSELIVEIGEDFYSVNGQRAETIGQLIELVKN